MKVALLIGVGKYLPSSGFKNLAAAKPDVEAMRQVLVKPEIGGFAEVDVVTLLNPEPQQMREALERLFASRKSDDLVVVYFSGHGVVDDFGAFHLTSTQTEKGLLNSTAIAAVFLHKLMETSRSKKQVVILDCCFSGAFAKGMAAKGGSVNLQAQLGGRGRAVLTSSSATEYSFEQKEASLSVYTQYVVEGLRTGIADQNGDGMISVDELHEFARAKVQDVAPAMQPKIYAVEEGYKIMVAKAPMGDPKLEYRKEVEKLADQRQGKFSAPILMALETKRQKLGLTSEIAASIQQEVLRPYEEFAAKILKYQQVFQQELQQGNQLSSGAWKDLQYFQHTLGLTDDNIKHLVRQVKISSVRIAPPRVVKPRADHSTATSKPSSRVAGLEYISTQARSPVKSPQNPIHSTVGTIVSFALIIGSIGLGWQILQSMTIPSPLVNVPSPGNTASTAEDLVQKGMEKYNKKDYQGAIDDYNQAIKLKPDYADAYNSRGVSRSSLGDKKEAIDDYNQAIKLKPDLAEAYSNRGITRSDLGDKKEAIDDYNQAIKLKSDYAEAYYSRGVTRSDLGDKKGAIEDYNQAITLNPDHAEAYCNRGSARANLDNFKGAIEDYNQAIKLKFDYVDAYYSRGFTRSSLGDFKGAVEDYDQALKLKPDYSIAYNNRGISRSNLGDKKGAIEDYDQALKLKPEFVEAYFNRGNIRSNLKDKKGAIEDYQKAADLYQTQGKMKDYQDILNQIKKLKL